MHFNGTADYQIARRTRQQLVQALVGGEYAVLKAHYIFESTTQCSIGLEHLQQRLPIEPGLHAIQPWVIRQVPQLIEDEIAVTDLIDQNSAPLL
ncbi:hypothetical protein D3C78_1466660 [compost metagenome]